MARNDRKVIWFGNAVRGDAALVGACRAYLQTNGLTATIAETPEARGRPVSGLAPIGRVGQG